MVNDRPYGSLAGTPLDYEEEQGYEDSYEEEYDYEGDYDDVDYEYNEIEDGDEGNEERGEEDDYALAIDMWEFVGQKWS